MIDYKSLDGKKILEEDIFTEIYDEQDPIQQAAIICTLSDMAKEFGVKQNFDRMLKAFKKARQSYNQQTGGSYTNFGDEYPKMFCGGWIANEDGISILTNFGERVACSHPILPVRTLINAETGFLKQVIAFQTRGKWREVIVDKEVICSNNRIVSLSKYGVRVTSENAKALVQYLSDIESMNEKLIPEQKSTSKLGWIGRSFVPYDDSIVFDNEDSLSGAFKSVTQKGSYNRWLDLVSEIRSSERIEPVLYMAGAFASPLLHLFNALPFIVSTYGKTGKGKTVALMLATSIWADPTEGKYFVRAKATDIALEVRLDFLNHLPMAVDDMTQIQNRVKDDFSDYIYTLCSGGGKERSNTQIGLQRQRSWKNVILTNSERSLVSETMNGGAINRIIEIESSEGNYFDSGAEVVEVIKEHFGYAGEEFIRIISHMDMQDIKAIQKEFLDRIYAKQFELGEEKEEKQIIPMSILLTADKIATDEIFQDGKYLDFDICYGLMKSKGDISEEERAYDFIMSDIQVHRNNFEPDRFTGQYRGEIWGAIDSGYAIINSNIFSAMCERGNFSRKSFLTWANRNGLLIKDDKGGKIAKNKKIDGKSLRCIFLKMDSDQEPAEEENNDFQPVNDKNVPPFK